MRQNPQYDTIISHLIILETAPRLSMAALQAGECMGADMKTAIMTDTNSGITAEEARSLGIYVLPMPVIIDDHSYLEGIDIQPE